jgi:ADP-ribose pyrophosphatase
METPIDLECIWKIESYGKIAFMQKFFLPKCGNEETFFLFGSKKKTVIIFPLTKDYRVITINHFRFGSNCPIIEVPGGNKENNETIIKAATRELEEETGFTSDDIKPLGNKIWIDPASFRAYFIPMLALNCYQKKRTKQQNNEKTEVLDIPVLTPLKDWIQKIKKKEICDSKTIAMTMMVVAHLGKDACKFME